MILRTYRKWWCAINFRYVRNIQGDPNFVKLKGLSDLCATLVKTNKCTTFYVAYKLLKLALILLVATTMLNAFSQL